MRKDQMIKEILTAVNAMSEKNKGTIWQTKKADGDLFFSLAFRSDKELKSICKEIGIKLN